jgi:N-methylhydantoinase B
VVANVEQYEARFPLLYLWRRQEADTGGAGRRRGGAGVGYAVTPRGVASIDTVSPHFSGTLEPESAGLLGGNPGAVNRVVLHRTAGIAATARQGRVPADPAALTGEWSPLPGVARLSLAADDVLEVATSGGGGWGDPIDREPERVAHDVRAGLVSPAEAWATFGVDLTDGGVPNMVATEKRRAAIRQERAKLIDVPYGIQGADHDHELPDPTSHEPAAGWRTITTPLAEDGPAAGFALKARYCPECLAAVSVERSVLTEGAMPG